MTITEIALALSNSPELSILAKATLLLTLGLASVGAARRARPSVRHILLAATFVALLALPVGSSLTPVHVDIAVAAPKRPRAAVTQEHMPDRAIGVATAVQPPVGRSASLMDISRIAWIAGGGLQLFLLVLHMLRLGQIRRTGVPWIARQELVRSVAAAAGLRRRVDVLLHEKVAAPVTCGAWRSVILLPADARFWSEDDLRRALTHELEHVRRNDWSTQFFARVTLACYWFHPLAWAAWRRLNLEAERAADDAVVRESESTAYAEQLVMLARRMSNAQTEGALGMANRGDLAARVAALLDGKQRRGRAGFLAAGGAIVAVALFFAAIAPMNAVAQSAVEPNRRAALRRVTALDRDLYEAAEAGDVQRINALLDAGANVNAAIDGDGSPLIGAARKGRAAAAVLLMNRGADPSLAVEGDGNPLIMAAAGGHTEVVALLLDRGARIDQVVPNDENPLIRASARGNLEVVRLLVKRGANVNIRVWADQAGSPAQGEWRSPLIMARMGGHGDVIDLLIASGARE